MRYTSALILALMLVGCGTTPDYMGVYGVQVVNATSFDLNYDEIDFIIAETVDLYGGDTARLEGLEITIVEESFSPNTGHKVGGWTELHEGVGEVAFAGDCFSSTAFGHELLHVLRGVHSPDHDHENLFVWGGMDGPWYVIGVEQSVKRRGSALYCGQESDTPTEPGTRLLASSM